MIGKAYMALDNFLVDRATDVVRAWNWTTGRTRGDLATLVTVPSLSVFPTTEFLNQNYGQALFQSFVAGIIGVGLKGLYGYMDRLEEKSVDNKVKHRDIEMIKNICKAAGPLFAISGVITVPLPEEEMHTLTHELSGAGAVGIGVSYYIMRAKYFPPRKSFFSRAKDRLAEMRSVYQGPIKAPR